MNYREMLDKARQNMKPKCRVCPECNGIACRGELPGTGGYGNGRSFTVCREYLKSVKICMDTLCPETDPDLKQTLLGQEWSMPLMIAPIGGMAFNLGKVYDLCSVRKHIVRGRTAQYTDENLRILKNQVFRKAAGQLGDHGRMNISLKRHGCSGTPERSILPWTWIRPIFRHLRKTVWGDIRKVRKIFVS